MSLLTDVVAIAGLVAILLTVALIKKLKNNDTINKSGAEVSKKLFEKIEAWARRRNEKWEYTTKLLFLGVVAFVVLGLTLGGDFWVKVVNFLLGACTVIWVIKMIHDEEKPEEKVIETK